MHIRDERGTREKFDLIGKEIPTGLGSNVVAWCGAVVSGHGCFLDAAHALTHLHYSGSQAPCRKCLRKLRAIIDKELKGGEG